MASRTRWRGGNPTKRMFRDCGWWPNGGQLSLRFLNMSKHRGNQTKGRIHKRMSNQPTHPSNNCLRWQGHEKESVFRAFVGRLLFMNHKVTLLTLSLDISLLYVRSSPCDMIRMSHFRPRFFVTRTERCANVRYFAKQMPLSVSILSKSSLGTISARTMNTRY